MQRSWTSFNGQEAVVVKILKLANEIAFYGLRGRAVAKRTAAFYLFLGSNVVG